MQQGAARKILQKYQFITIYSATGERGGAVSRSVSIDETVSGQVSLSLSMNP